MRRWSLTAVMCVAWLSASGCKRAPCEGGGKMPDTAALAEPWTRLGAVPAEAVACRFDDGSTGGDDWNKHFELPGLDASAAAAAWRKQITASGWKELGFVVPTGDACTYELTAEREGHRLEVAVSKCTDTDNGWSTVALKVPSAAPAK